MGTQAGSPNTMDLITRDPLLLKVRASSNNLQRGVISGTEFFSSGAANSSASTPDTAALDILGDIGVRVYDMRPSSVTWTPLVAVALASKFDATANQRSWAFGLLPNARLRFMWSVNGSSTLQIDSSVAVTPSPGLSVRVDFDADNGAAGRTATFYTSTSQGSSWDLLEAVTTATATSIFSSSAAVLVGGLAVGTSFGVYAGRLGKVEIYNSAGTKVADPDFAQPLGTTSFADSTGKTWTMNNGAVIATKQSR